VFLITIFTHFSSKLFWVKTRAGQAWLYDRRHALPHIFLCWLSLWRMETDSSFTIWKCAIFLMSPAKRDFTSHFTKIKVFNNPHKHARFA
jgi:hypothetical protein